MTPGLAVNTVHTFADARSLFAVPTFAERPAAKPAAPDKKPAAGALGLGGPSCLQPASPSSVAVLQGRSFQGTLANTVHTFANTVHCSHVHTFTAAGSAAGRSANV